MGVEKLADRQIKDNIRRYHEAGRAEGGPFSLAELELELLRRTRSPFPHVEVARKIIELAKASSDNRVTYKEIWSVFRPGQQWIGNAPRMEMANSLGRVIAYCVQKGLPLLSVLVVQSGTRRLDPKAKENIYNEAKKYGVKVGPDPERFIEEQTQMALALVVTDLPEEAFAAD